MKEIKSYAEFKEVIASEKPVIIKFGAPWCGPCKQVDQVLEEIDLDSDFKTEVYKLNIDNVPEPATDFAVMGIPMIFAFAQGNLIKKHVGLASPEQIKSLIWGK